MLQPVRVSGDRGGYPLPAAADARAERHTGDDADRDPDAVTPAASDTVPAGVRGLLFGRCPLLHGLHLRAGGGVVLLPVVHPLTGTACAAAADVLGRQPRAGHAGCAAPFCSMHCTSNQIGSRYLT